MTLSKTIYLFTVVLSKEEYIAKYGDVFQSSINILGLPDSDFMGAELSDAEKEELKNFEKQLKGN